MCCVYFVRTEYTSRCDHTDREFSLLHHTGLYRRCLCTKYDILINIESILLILSRVICRDVQFLKVVQIILNFRSFYNLISHTYEDTLYFFQRDCVRMSVSNTVLLRWKCYVDHFCFQLLLTDCLLHSCLRFL